MLATKSHATKSQRATKPSTPAYDFVARDFVACYNVAKFDVDKLVDVVDVAHILAQAKHLSPAAQITDTRQSTYVIN